MATGSQIEAQTEHLIFISSAEPRSVFTSVGAVLCLDLHHKPTIGHGKFRCRHVNCWGLLARQLSRAM